MKSSSVLILCVLNFISVFGQQEIAVFDLTEILSSIPKDALPLSEEKLDSAMDAHFNPRYHSYFKETEVKIPNDNSVETHYTQFHLPGKIDEKENFYFEFKIYLTKKDTLLLSIYRSQEELETWNEITPPKNRVDLNIKAYKLKRLKEFEEIPLPEVTPTDFAKAPKDSVIIENQKQNYDIMFLARFETQHQEKGIHFILHDLTLNTGPFEPPVTRAPKYFSDYETIDRPIRFQITPNGIIY